MEEMTSVVINSSLGASAQKSLFKGIIFWIAQRVPQRSTFIENVRRNGGDIVRLENRADILIADHARKDSPTDSYSYTWIEQSIRDGRLADKEQHRAGPQRHDVRQVGALRSAKQGRNPYTKQDDELLYKWVKDHERRGEKALGNEIYKKLEIEVRSVSATRCRFFDA